MFSMEASLLDTQRFRLPKGKLVLLCDIPEVVHYLQQCDYMLYQTIMETLIPDVLKPIPGSLTQSLRTFAKNLESWMKLAVKELPSKFVTAKVRFTSRNRQTNSLSVSCVCRFPQSLRLVRTFVATHHSTISRKLHAPYCKTLSRSLRCSWT